MRRTFSAFLTAVSALPLVALAGEPIFPDVPADHLYREEIEELVGARIINGNDDGTFAPERAVNRAEMLALLYRATGRTPDPTAQDCFPDVEGWYESIVCDAAAKRLVHGYPSGLFLPGASVNRVEALKMIVGMFGIQTQEYGVAERDIIKFVDVSTSAWYSGYLYTAFTTGILPIRGQDGARFYPEWPLLRGEAAAYISHALKVGIQQSRSAESSSSRSARAPVSSVTSLAASSSARPTSQAVTFPFSVSGKFDAKKSFSYTFSIANDLTAMTTVKLTGATGAVSCRLYLIGENGFTTEYYLGYQEGSTCTILSALRAGQYQLQIQPTVADAAYTVDVKGTAGDGNDGFREAKRLLPGVATTVTLLGTNYADYYTFTVLNESSMKVELGNSANLSCIVYPMADVDLASFSGPQCNQNYLYPKGTYVVAVGRNATAGAKLTYTLLLR